MTTQITEALFTQFIATFRWWYALDHPVYVTLHHDEALVDESGELLKMEK